MKSIILYFTVAFWISQIATGQVQVQEKPVNRDDMISFIKSGMSQNKVSSHFGTPSNTYVNVEKETLLTYEYFPIPEKPINPDGGIPSGIMLIFKDSKLVKWMENYRYKRLDSNFSR